MPFRIDTYVGSITDPEVGAHAIVNAGNSHVALGSGVSGAISEACGGIAFQKECRDALEDEFGEPLELGDCLVTSSGTATAFRWVLHVASVQYRSRDPETGGSSGPTRVRMGIEAAMNEAARLAKDNQLSEVFELGVPLLGAGHGGLGVVAAVRWMMDGIANAKEARAHLACVRFVVLEPAHTGLVASAAQMLR